MEWAEIKIKANIKTIVETRRDNVNIIFPSDTGSVARIRDDGGEKNAIEVDLSLSLSLEFGHFLWKVIPASHRKLRGGEIYARIRVTARLPGFPNH